MTLGLSAETQSRCALDRGDEQGGVAVVQSGDGFAEADVGACGEAGGELEDASFAAGAGEFSGVEGGDGGVPVDVRHRGGAVADAGPGRDEAAGEVVAAEEG